MKFSQALSINSVKSNIFDTTKYLSSVGGETAAAFSVRQLNKLYKGPLMRVRRDIDNAEKDIGVKKGVLDEQELLDFVNGAPNDIPSGQAASYSVRKLNKEYTGPCINVRRSSNGDVQDIGFDSSGNLDETALTSFVNESVEKIVNGDFATDSNWTKGTGWTISGGAANCDGTQTSSSELKTALGLDIQGAEVTFSFQVKNYSAGTLSATIEGTGKLDFNGINANGVYSTTATSTDLLPRVAFIASSDFVGSIDDVSVIQTTADGFVTKWYDQSGNGNDAIQGTALSQPKIVSAGTVVKENGRPALLPNDLTDLLSAPTYVGSANFWSFSTSKVTLDYTVLITGDTGGEYPVVSQDGSTSTLINNGSGTPVYYLNGSTPSWATRSDVYNDLISQNLLTISADTSSYTDLYIGYDHATVGMFKMQELIIYHSDQSANRTAIEANINDYYSIYTPPQRNAYVSVWHDQSPVVNSLNEFLNKKISDSSGIDESPSHSLEVINETDSYQPSLLCTCSAYSGNELITIGYTEELTGNDAIQTIRDNQPQIVSNGVILKENGKPALRYDGLGDELELTYNINLGVSDFMTEFVYNSESEDYVLYGDSAQSRFRLYDNEVQVYINNVIYSFPTTPNFNQQHLYTLEADSARGLQLYKNSFRSGNELTISTGNGFIQEYIGYGSTRPMKGKLQEAIIYNSDKSLVRKEIENNINDYYDIYVPFSEFSPLSLFASGEQGAWYDPSDLSTLFQDVNGNTPAGVGDPVGLMLDKSQELTLGSELVTNGTFDTDSDWAKGTGWSISGGSASHVAGTASILSQSVSLTLGRTYKATCDVIAINGGTGALQFRNGGTTTTVTLETASVGKTISLLYVAEGNNDIAVFAGSGTNITIDNITVKELAGNHATQSTSTARPILQQSGGLYYLDFDGVDDCFSVSGMSSTSTPLNVFSGHSTDDGESVNFQYIIDIETGRTIAAASGFTAGSIGYYDGSWNEVDINTEVATVATYLIQSTSGGIRINGSSVLSDSATENAIGGDISIGSRYIRDQSFLDGKLYQLIIRAATTSGVLLTNTEAFIASKTGVTL